MTDLAANDDYRIAVDGACLHFRLNRPDKANAINGAIPAGLERAVALLAEGDLRVLLVSAEGGRFFSAGADLNEAQGLSTAANIARCDAVRDVLFRLRQSRVFSVAVIDGMALGGGLELAMACSLRVASAGATMGMPEVTLGLMPAFGGTQMLSEIIGRGRALEMMLTGARIDAARALALGLVDHVEPDGDAALAKAQAIADRVAGHDARAVTAILDCVQAGQDPAPGEALAREGDAQVRLLAGRATLPDALDRG